MKRIGIVLLIILSLSSCKRYLTWRYEVEEHRENLRREVFESTKSYNQGMIQNLLKYRHEYYTTDSIEEKKMILSTVRVMYADYENYSVDPEIKDFLDLAKYGE